MSIGNLVFYILLTLWTFYATYMVVFKILPSFGRRMVSEQHGTSERKRHTADHARPQHSSHDGFRAFARNGELTEEDIVKALSRED